MHQDSIEHYGVKGMKWGVRRTPQQLGHVSSSKKPYRSTPKRLVEKGANLKQSLAKDILGRKISKSQAIPRNQDASRTDLKKGSELRHISGVDFSKIKAGQLYVTAMSQDHDLYQAFLGAKLKRAGFEPKSISFKLKKDLHAPSSKDQYKIFSEFLKNNKKQVEDDVSAWLESKGKGESLATSKRDIYDQFINSVEKPSQSQKKFYNELRKRGYNAVLDEHDITGSWMQGQKPLIIMDTLNMLGSMKVTELTDESMSKALDRVLKSKS